MDIVYYPDPVLRKSTAAVETFGPELHARTRAMLDTMYTSRGVGLAAPQVGLPLRLLVANPSGDPAVHDQELVLVNPRVIKTKGWDVKEEGCLSFPGIYAEITRHLSVVIEAQDTEGGPLTLELTGFPARVVLHEFDHLDGTLFIDRMTPADRIRVRARLRELEERFKTTRAGA
jgi:peptide deformylase